jgi:Zn-dependent protease
LLDSNIGQLLLQLVPLLLVLLFSLTVHESAHAWTANRLGDPTARRLGRISLNPAVHIDPIGTILLPLVAFMAGGLIFGWAKPVPVNPANLKNYRRDFLVIAAAGPASNVLLATAASLLMRVGLAGAAASGGIASALFDVGFMVIQLNLLLAVFNMIPIPPLDGGNVLTGLLPGPLADGYDRVVRPYGFMILLVLMMTGTLGYLIVPPYLFLSGLLTP